MPVYRTCDYCGANNDPGEKCWCQAQNLVVVAHRDGDTISTRINGPRESAVDHRIGDALTEEVYPALLFYQGRRKIGCLAMQQERPRRI